MKIIKKMEEVKNMKKIICLLLLIMLMPNLVLADAGGPTIMGYDAIVTNKKGAKESYGETIIPYNAKIHVYNEYEDYVEVEWNNKKDYTINKKDIAPYREEYIPSDKDVKKNTDYYDGVGLENIEEYIIIYEKNGLKLSKGPSSVYKKYDKIVPYKTKVKVTYGAGYWYYVDDGEYKGWVSVDDTIALHNYIDIVLLTDTKMVDDNNNYLSTIPAETFINKNNLYYLTDGSKFLVNYNGEEGYIGVKNGDKGYLYSFDYAILSEYYNLITLKSVGITSLDGKVRTAVNSGEMLDKVYYKDITWDGPEEPVCIGKTCYFYVEYKGTKGFIKDENVILFGKDEKTDTIVTKEEIKMYTVDLYNYLKNNDSEVVNENIKNKYYKGVIPKGTTLYEYTNWWYYKNDNQERASDFYIVKYKNEIVTVFIDDDDNIPKEPIKDIPKMEQETKKVEKNNSKEIILFGVIGAIILALVAFVIIKLVNKKKKIKKEEKNVRDITANKNETVKEGITNKIDNSIKKEEPKEEKKIEVENSNNISTNNSIKKEK